MRPGQQYLIWGIEALQNVGTARWGGSCSAWLKRHGAEANGPSLAFQLPQIFLMCIINYHPVLFSFYSFFQAISGKFTLCSGPTMLETGVFIFLCQHLSFLATNPATNWGASVTTCWPRKHQAWELRGDTTVRASSASPWVTSISWREVALSPRVDIGLLSLLLEKTISPPGTWVSISGSCQGVMTNSSV